MQNYYLVKLVAKFLRLSVHNFNLNHIFKHNANLMVIYEIYDNMGLGYDMPMYVHASMS